VEQCNDTTQEIQAQGGPEAACDDAAEIGEGQAVALVGGTSLKIPLRVWNRRNAMVISFKVGNAGFFAISPIRGRTVSVPLGQAPALDARATEFTLGIGRTAAGAAPYLRTPRTCPSTRKWRSTLQYRTHNAGLTTLRTTARCAKR
jgi:hypothetical protein